MRIASSVKIFKNIEPKIQRLRKFSKIYKRRSLDFSKLEKLELEVLNKIKEPPNIGFLFYLFQEDMLPGIT